MEVEGLFEVVVEVDEMEAGEVGDEVERVWTGQVVHVQAGWVELAGARWVVEVLAGF